VQKDMQTRESCRDSKRDMQIDMEQTPSQFAGTRVTMQKCSSGAGMRVATQNTDQILQLSRSERCLSCKSVLSDKVVIAMHFVLDGCPGV
jgi:succinate dehydrogenase/fumarate reductase-like Fe-S protein